MNTGIRNNIPTKVDFAKIAEKTGYELIEFYVHGEGNRTYATIAAPLTDEIKRDGVRPTVMLCARHSHGTWEFWASDIVLGLHVLGEISSRRHLPYRYVIAVPK